MDANYREERYFESLARVIEGARDPRTPADLLELVLDILERDGVFDAAKQATTPEERHLAIMNRINRMKPYLAEQTYSFLIHRFHSQGEKSDA
jgi:hypothetical protein